MSKTRLKVTQNNYCRERICPACETDRIFTPSSSFCGQPNGTGFVHGHCTQCGAQWNEVYKLMGFRMLEAKLNEADRVKPKPWEKEPENTNVKKKILDIDPIELPMGKANIKGAFVICNDGGVLKVYR